MQNSISGFLTYWSYNNSPKVRFLSVWLIYSKLQILLLWYITGLFFTRTVSSYLTILLHYPHQAFPIHFIYQPSWSVRFSCFGSSRYSHEQTVLSLHVTWPWRDWKLMHDRGLMHPLVHALHAYCFSHCCWLEDPQNPIFQSTTILYYRHKSCKIHALF